MGLADLSTLNGRARERYAEPKHAMKTRLDEKVAADAADERGLERFRTDVRERDKATCRICRKKTKRTLKLEPLRGEAAHIVRRAEKAVRHDRRNGLHVCHVCHGKFDRREIRIDEATARRFVVGNRDYIDGDDLNIRFVAA